MPALPTAAVGLVTHYGRAIAVSVTAGSEPVVVDRRELDLSPAGLPSAPYHHEGPELPLADAEALIAKVRAAVATRARDALRTLREDLADTADVNILAIRESRPMLATLADILGSRAVYIADAELYRDAVHDAAVALGLAVVVYPKDDELASAARALKSDVGALAERIRGWRKIVGPPWQKDHHAAAAAALSALGVRT